MNEELDSALEEADPEERKRNNVSDGEDIDSNTGMEDEEDEIFAYDKSPLTELGNLLNAGARVHGVDRLEFFVDYMEAMEDIELRGEEVKEELWESYESSRVNRELGRLQDLGMVDPGFRHTSLAAGFKVHVADPLLEYVDEEAVRSYNEAKEEIEEEIDSIVQQSDHISRENIDIEGPKVENFIGVDQETYDQIKEETVEGETIYDERNIRIVSEILGNLYTSESGNRAGVFLEEAENPVLDRSRLADHTNYGSSGSISATVSVLDDHGFFEGQKSDRRPTELGEAVKDSLDNFYAEIEGYLKH